VARPRAPSGVCGLGGVIRRVFYFYSILSQPVISTDHDFPFVDPTAIFSYQQWPPRRSRFFVLFWIEVENQQSTSAEGYCLTQICVIVVPLATNWNY